MFFSKMSTKLRWNKSDVLALLKALPSDYDSDTDVDEDFDKGLYIT